jgi:hypothetical protein
MRFRVRANFFLPAVPIGGASFGSNLFGPSPRFPRAERRGRRGVCRVGHKAPYGELWRKRDEPRSLLSSDDKSLRVGFGEDAEGFRRSGSFYLEQLPTQSVHARHRRVVLTQHTHRDLHTAETPPPAKSWLLAATRLLLAAPRWLLPGPRSRACRVWTADRDLLACRRRLGGWAPIPWMLGGLGGGDAGAPGRSVFAQRAEPTDQGYATVGEPTDQVMLLLGVIESRNALYHKSPLSKTLKLEVQTPVWLV